MASHRWLRELCRAWLKFARSTSQRSSKDGPHKTALYGLVWTHGRGLNGRNHFFCSRTKRGSPTRWKRRQIFHYRCEWLRSRKPCELVWMPGVEQKAEDVRQYACCVEAAVSRARRRREQ